MKKTKRLWALLLAMVMALGLISTAFAAPTIDSGRKASLSLYKYDITAASADGAWDAASYVSTGVQDDAVTDKLAQYAIQGVEFSYLRVASISTYSQRENGQYKVGVLYGFADDAVLQAIGLTKADAYKRGNGVFYFTSDKLNKALADALADNATTVKNALEIAVRNGGAIWNQVEFTSDMEMMNTDTMDGEYIENINKLIAEHRAEIEKMMQIARETLEVDIAGLEGNL